MEWLSSIIIDFPLAFTASLWPVLKVIHASYDTWIYIFNLACQILSGPRCWYVLKMHKNAFHSLSFITNARMEYSAHGFDIRSGLGKKLQAPVMNP